MALADYASTFIVSYDRIFHPPVTGRFADLAHIESAHDPVPGDDR